MIRLGTGLPAVLSDILRSQPVTPAKVDFAWRRAAGPALARIATLALGVDGTLHVEVETKQWKRELDRAAPLLLARLEPILGPQTVRRLDVRARTAERAPRRRSTGPRARPRG
jgi:hypothetical protein